MTEKISGNSKRGGKRPGAGRPKGVPNKINRALKEIAQQYTEDALQVLQDVMKNGDSDAARVAAAREMLDRGYGKPKTTNEHTGPDGAAIQFNVITGIDRTHR
jgi:hypothetical protein